jgi:hypothetical protein
MHAMAGYTEEEGTLEVADKGPGLWILLFL